MSESFPGLSKVDERLFGMQAKVEHLWKVRASLLMQAGEEMRALEAQLQEEEQDLERSRHDHKGWGALELEEREKTVRLRRDQLLALGQELAEDWRRPALELAFAKESIKEAVEGMEAERGKKRREERPPEEEAGEEEELAKEGEEEFEEEFEGEFEEVEEEEEEEIEVEEEEAEWVVSSSSKEEEERVEEERESKVHLYESLLQAAREDAKPLMLATNPKREERDSALHTPQRLSAALHFEETPPREASPSISRAAALLKIASPVSPPGKGSGSLMNLALQDKVENGRSGEHGLKVDKVHSLLKRAQARENGVSKS